MAAIGRKRKVWRRASATGGCGGVAGRLRDSHQSQRSAEILCKALAEQHLRYRVRRDSGWQNSALSDDTQTRLAMLEALGVGADLSGVTISTIHASKGLEFKHVFLIGCSEGLIPYGLPQDDDVLEEERRLMYVAVTRAEDTLDVSYARTREGNEGERARRVSRFFR